MIPLRTLFLVINMYWIDPWSPTPLENLTVQICCKWYNRFRCYGGLCNTISRTKYNDNKFWPIDWSDHKKLCYRTNQWGIILHFSTRPVLLITFVEMKPRYCCRSSCLFLLSLLQRRRQWFNPLWSFLRLVLQPCLNLGLLHNKKSRCGNRVGSTKDHTFVWW